MDRTHYKEIISNNFYIFKAGALLGPRQVGKTTLARQIADQTSGFNYTTNYFDLENPTDLQRLEAPKLALESLEGLVIVDEIQRRPDLFPVLRYLLDRPDNKAKYLILGSASRDLIQQSSESLAGRIFFQEIQPFSVQEVGSNNLQTHWLRGGFPLAFLAEKDEQSFVWHDEYIRTYLERDIPALGIQIPPATLRRFWTMLTHNHGNILNSSELARSFGVADTTIRRYLDILSGTFMIRQLQPWFANIKKRQVKSPKIYFRDSGILHALMGIRSRDHLQTHLKVGASWEGYALEEVIRKMNAKPEECYFWAVHAQAEVDLLISKEGKLHAFEFKYSDAPKVTRSMQNALETLKLDRLTIVAPVETSFPLAERIWVTPIA